MKYNKRNKKGTSKSTSIDSSDEPLSKHIKNRNEIKKDNAMYGKHVYELKCRALQYLKEQSMKLPLRNVILVHKVCFILCFNVSMFHCFIISLFHYECV